jgi:hypothetical protein
MNQSAAQLLRMSRLLDDVLTLDQPARERWLAQLAHEHADLSPALRKALTADSPVFHLDSVLPRLGTSATEPASGLVSGQRVGP